MNKNQKNSLILVVVIVVVFVLAYFGYNQLSKKSPGTSNVTEIKVDSSKLSELESKSKTISNDNKTEPKKAIDNVSTSNKDEKETKEEAEEITKTEETKEDIENTSAQNNDENKEETKKEVSDDSDDSLSSESSKEVEEENSDEQSNIMPDIPLVLLNGEETTFWQLAGMGKPTVINLFASWCPPCKNEMPDFIEANQEYKDRVTFIFFDSFDGQRETKEKVEAFAAEYFKEDTNVVLDPGYISYLFQSNSLPTTVIINKEGVPSFLYQGMISKETLTLAIDELLAE